MTCPRGYRSTIKECKHWALKHCHGISPQEKHWLRTKLRSKRSPWACHAGALVIFKWLYETTTGKNCETNHVVGLRDTLKEITKAMDISRRAMQTINGKVVYLFRLTDTVTTKLNILSQDLKTVDQTLSFWSTAINTFAQQSSCFQGLLFQYFSKYSTQNNRAFASIMRLMEIQDIFQQITRLNQEVLVGYADLPKFITSQLSIQLSNDPLMAPTITALEEGLSVLARPLIDFEHNGNYLDLNLLFIAPIISNADSFCTIEYLSPLKFNISNQCYTGMVTQTNLALINCKNSQTIITVEALEKCFQNEKTVLCPANILKMVRNIPWLGYPWNPDLRLSVSRHHVPASNCDGLHPLVFLGGRHFLSTTSGSLNLNSGTLEISPLVVYNFPCNVSFDGMKTGLTTCPKSLGITLPIFTSDSITYIPWQTVADPQLLELHYKSLKIPPNTKVNKTIINALDSLYKQLDLQLAETINTANKKINNIIEVSTSTLKEILLYVAFSLSVANSIILATWFYILACRRRPPQTPTSTQSILLPSPQQQPRPKQKQKCRTCRKPLKTPATPPESIELEELKKDQNTQ